jgi:hypothetical protein
MVKCASKRLQRLNINLNVKIYYIDSKSKDDAIYEDYKYKDSICKDNKCKKQYV